MTPEDYFGSHEQPLRTLGELADRIEQVDALQRKTGLTYYWRGQANAEWGVHSLLHRCAAAVQGIPISEVTEQHVVRRETEIVDISRDWVRPDVGARLATTDLLARLQHFGVPTRLVDFTDDPLVALHFAVAHEPASDARLVLAAARGVPPVELREAFDVPWSAGHRLRPASWGSTLFCLDDHRDFLRIVRQSGVFLTGGTPSTTPQRRTAAGVPLKASDVRTCMSLPLALHSWRQAEAALDGTSVKGKSPTIASALTLRIPAAAKPTIRAELDAKGCRVDHLFPDVPGLRDHEPSVQLLLNATGP